MASTSLESKKEEPLIPPLNPYSPQEIASFDKLDLALRSHPELAREGASLLNPKALARLVQGIKFFQDVHLGCHPTSKYAKTKKWPVVKLPDEFFRMRESDGPLFHLFVSAYMYKKEASWRQFDFQSKIRFNDNIALLKKIQNDLVANGHLKRPVVYFDESVPQEQLAEYKAIVKKFGGRVVKSFYGAKGDEDAPTHIVAWDEEEHDSVETLEKERAAGDVVEKVYLRTLAVVDPTKTKKIGGIIETTMQDSKKKGGKIKHAKGAAPIEFKDPMAFVHWWYHPSSYDEWMPAADVAGPDTEAPPRPIGGPWIVACKFIRDVSIFNEWGWEGDYALSDYQNKAKCYPVLEQKLAEEAKAREAPKPSTLKIRLTLSSSAKTEKAKVEKDEEKEEMKDREEASVDVKSTSPQPILQQESKVAPERLGMESKQILTGFYTAGGNKKQKMTVHNGALQPPSEALDLVCDAIKEVQSDAFDGKDKNIKLPVIDSFVRPSLDPNMASKFLVTEMKPGVTGSTEITERKQNNIDAVPNKDGSMADEDGDVKMADVGEGKAVNEESLESLVPTSNTSTMPLVTSLKDNNAVVKIKESTPKDLQARSDVKMADVGEGKAVNDDSPESLVPTSNTSAMPLVTSLKDNNAVVKIKESTPKDLQARGAQKSDVVPAHNLPEKSCDPKQLPNSGTVKEDCHSTEIEHIDKLDDTSQNAHPDLVGKSTSEKSVPLSLHPESAQEPESLTMKNNDADGDVEMDENNEVVVSVPEQVNSQKQAGSAMLKSGSVDNPDEASHSPEMSSNSKNLDALVSSTIQSSNQSGSGALDRKLSESESALVSALEDVTKSSQSVGTAIKGENKNIQASLPRETSTGIEPAMTVLSCDITDDTGNITRSPNASKEEDKTTVNISSTDGPKNTLQDPDVAQSESDKKASLPTTVNTQHSTEPKAQMENKDVDFPINTSSSAIPNTVNPKTSTMTQPSQPVTVPFTKSTSLNSPAVHTSATKAQDNEPDQNVPPMIKTTLKSESKSTSGNISPIPSKLAPSIESDDDIPELQMTEPDVVPVGAYSRALPDNPSISKAKKTIPLYGEQELTTKLPSWYDKNAASDVEKTLLPEWFNNSADHRTESSYVETREKIIDEARQSSSKYLTWTAVRRCVAGDAGSIMRLHEFLVTWGFINGSAIGDNAPLQVTDEAFDSDSRLWSPEMKNLLCLAVARCSRKRKFGSESTERLEIDWDAVSKEVGNGATPDECYKIFLATDFSHIGDGDNDMKLPQEGSNNQKGLSKDNFILELIDGIQPNVAKAVIHAALNACDGDVNAAQNASVVGLIASKAAQRAREEESTTMRILEEILDLRMAKLENRLSLLDDLEGMLDAERMALELERRDLYTRRCRHWFNADSSL